MVALSTLAKTPTLRRGFQCLEQMTLGQELGGSREPRDSYTLLGHLDPTTTRQRK